MAEEKKQKFAAAESKMRGGGPPGSRGGYQKPQNAMKTIKRLLTYISAHKGLLVLIAFFLVAGTAAYVELHLAASLSCYAYPADLTAALFLHGLVSDRDLRSFLQPQA